MSTLSDFKEQILEFINDVIKPIYRNYIAIGSFIYLVTQLIAIFLGIRIIVPLEYRNLTIWIAFFIIIIYFTYYWIKSKLEKVMTVIRSLNKAKDPSISVVENLSYIDLEFAIYNLTKQIVDSNFLTLDKSGKKFDAKKNIIIGIDRGGAIVGGMLAKNLGLAIETLAVFYANPPQTKMGVETSIRAGGCLENIDFFNVEKVLLVDDAIRTGVSMTKAVDMLNQILKEKGKSDQIEVKIACILSILEYRKLVNPHFSVYKTEYLTIKLPWDKMRWSKEMVLEE